MMVYSWSFGLTRWRRQAAARKRVRSLATATANRKVSEPRWMLSGSAHFAAIQSGCCRCAKSLRFGRSTAPNPGLLVHKGPKQLILSCPYPPLTGACPSESPAEKKYSRRIGGWPMSRAALGTALSTKFKVHESCGHGKASKAPPSRKEREKGRAPAFCVW